MFQSARQSESTVMKKRDPVAITHADLAILGASGEVFSIGTKAHTADVQIAVLVGFVVH
jgi:hypothetical protein